MPAQPSFFARLWLAIVCWFRIVFDAQFAAGVLALRRGAGPALPAEKPALPPQPASQVLPPLVPLQGEGRLIDFCERNLAGFPDAQLEAAARTVLGGCRKALRGAFPLAPVRAEAE